MARTSARTLGTVATALAVLGTGAVTATPAVASKPHKDNPNSTSFALRAWGYGTRVQGGQLPTGSGATAYEVIGCTNIAGKNKSNQLADVNLPGLGTVSTLKTRVWTTKSGRTVASNAQNSIGKITLSDSPLGTLVLNAVTTTARAYHDAQGFHASTHTDVAKLSFKPPVGPPVELEVPTPGDPIEIPGFAKIKIAHAWKPTTRDGARAFANGLKVKLLATDTTVRVAHAVAQIGSDMKTGVFSGKSYALGGSVLGGTVDLGSNAVVKLPCQGTDGAVKSRKLADVDLGGQVSVAGAESRAMGDQTKHRAWGWQESRVAAIDLGDGALHIDGVVGRVKVSRKARQHGGTLRRSAAGTSIGQIVVDGEAQELPLDQTIEIPGVAKLEPKVVTRIPNGIKVTALRITLLDENGAVIELGNARLKIRRLPKR